MQIEISKLKPHAKQVDIYGDEPIDSDLVKSIKDNGVLQAIIVSDGFIILSGFRRWMAASKAGLKTVPIEERHGLNNTEQLAVLIEANRQRVKTPRQMGREAIALQEIESERARLRKLATQKNDSGRAVSATLRSQSRDTEGAAKGKTTESIGKHLGMGARTVEKLIEVEKKIESLEESGRADEAKKIEKTLNQKSINAAYTQIKPHTEPKVRQPIVPKTEPVISDELAGITEEWVRGKHWELGAVIMRKLTGKTDIEARKIIGKLIHDCSQSAVVGALAIAGNNMNFIKSEKLEPVAYVKAIANRIRYAGNGTGKQDSNKLLLDRMIAERT